MLGFAVGAKSSTTPVYAAESAPKTIRGALTMMWQMWTAFGIMLGFIVSVAFQNVTIIGGPTSPWRWMLASTSIPPMIVCIQVYFCPESPRWYVPLLHTHTPQFTHTDSIQGIWKKENSTKPSALSAVSGGPRSKPRATCTTPTSSSSLRMPSARGETHSESSLWFAVTGVQLRVLSS